MTASRSGNRVAVVARIHNVTDKVRTLIEGLAGGEGYDFFVHPNVMRPLDFGDYPSVPHSLEDVNALGFAATQEYFLMHCADLLFSVIRKQLPDYDHYVMVEYDVQFVRPGREFMGRLARALASEEYADVALAGTIVGPRDSDWMWRQNVADRYPDVWGVFFPLVVLSAGAIDRLLELRLEERRRTGRTDAMLLSPDPQNLMYCEAFVASALKAEGARLLDITEIFPGSVDARLFTVGMPKLMTETHTDDPAVEMIHPVFGPREFLERRLWRAKQDGTVADFLAEVERVTPFIPADLKAEFLNEGRAALAA